MYRINNWVNNFETKRSATFERRQHLEFSTHYRDQNLLWLLDHKNGAAHFGIFILICEWHACTTKPREGYLTHNGKADGFPMTPEKFSKEFGIATKLVMECLERCSMPNIGWFDKILDERSVSAAQEQSENSAHAASLSLAYFTLPYSMDFSAFWKSYPRKDKKRKAFQAWEKHQPPLEQCLATLEKHKMDWDDPKYIPLPTTWINENRWEDEGVVTNGSISQAELTSMIRNNECERGDYKQVSKDSEGYRYVHTG